MKVLKIFTDFVADMELLGDAERGRLFTAMLQYASTGEAPELKGNERFVWGTAKKNIDIQLENYESTCERNRKIATTRYDSSRVVTTEHESCQEKTKKRKDKEGITPLNPPKGGVEGFIKKTFDEFAGGNKQLLTALNDYAAMRKRIKKPIATEQTVTRLLEKLKKEFEPSEWVPVLNQSVDRCWQDIYPLKASSKYVQDATPPETIKPPDTIRRQK